MGALRPAPKNISIKLCAIELGGLHNWDVSDRAAQNELGGAVLQTPDLDILDCAFVLIISPPSAYTSGMVISGHSVGRLGRGISISEDVLCESREVNVRVRGN